MRAFAVQTASVLHKQFEPCLQDKEWQLDKPKINCPAERNMLREMYNFDSIGFLLYKLSYM
jgi:hypothetical protein